LTLPWRHGGWIRERPGWIREKPHRARRKSCEVGGASHGRGGTGRDRAPSPTQPPQPSIAGDRFCKLLFESIEESAGDDDLVVAGHERPRAPVTGSNRAREPWAKRYQPDWPITNRPPATYRDSIITSQRKPPKKNKSRTTFSLTPAETRVLALLTTYQTLAGIGSQLGIARSTVKTHVQTHLQETRGYQTSRSSKAR